MIMTTSNDDGVDSDAHVQPIDKDTNKDKKDE